MLLLEIDVRLGMSRGPGSCGETRSLLLFCVMYYEIFLMAQLLEECPRNPFILLTMMEIYCSAEIRILQGSEVLKDDDEAITSFSYYNALGLVRWPHIGILDLCSMAKQPRGALSGESNFETFPAWFSTTAQL